MPEKSSHTNKFNIHRFSLFFFEQKVYQKLDADYIEVAFEGCLIVEKVLLNALINHFNSLLHSTISLLTLWLEKIDKDFKYTLAMKEGATGKRQRH